MGVFALTIFFVGVATVIFAFVIGVAGVAGGDELSLRKSVLCVDLVTLGFVGVFFTDLTGVGF